MLEKAEVEEKPKQLSWKRILLFFLVLSILLFSLLYYVFSTSVHPLRVDSIPEGAYVVPWMRPNPSIDELCLNPQQLYGPLTFDIDDVMAEALMINMTFTIQIPNGTRVVSSTVYLGHDLNYLYIGGKFVGMYTNPASIPNNRTVPNYLSIFLDVAADGVLNYPESGSRLSAYVTSAGSEATFYHDMMWTYSRLYLGSSRWAWIMADNYYSNDLNRVQPASSLGNMISEYDNSTGTVVMLFSRFLRLPDNSEMNILQIQPDECWVIAFLFELGYATNSEAGSYVDGWPMNIYPYPDNNASSWPKLAIDLTNPP